MRHGLYSTYVNHGCRCDLCGEAARKYYRTGRPLLCRERYDVCPHADLVHGRMSTYNHHRCRCPLCVEVKRSYEREATRRRKQRARAGEVEVPHGTDAGHRVWGCRCRRCRLASAERNRQQFLRRRDRR